MASERLTEGLKEVILRGLLEYSFKNEAEEICKENETIALEYLSELYTPKEREMMKALPKKFFPVLKSLWLYMEGDCSGCCLHYELKDYMQVGYHHYHRNHMIQPRSKLGERLTKLNNRRKDLDVNRREARNKAIAIMNSVTTTKRLAEIWPEIEPFIPGPNKVANLPVDLNSVNAIFKLPKVEAPSEAATA